MGVGERSEQWGSPPPSWLSNTLFYIQKRFHDHPFCKFWDSQSWRGNSALLHNNACEILSQISYWLRIKSFWNFTSDFKRLRCSRRSISVLFNYFMYKVNSEISNTRKSGSALPPLLFHASFCYITGFLACSGFTTIERTRNKIELLF